MERSWMFYHLHKFVIQFTIHNSIDKKDEIKYSCGGKKVIESTLWSKYTYIHIPSHPGYTFGAIDAVGIHKSAYYSGSEQIN